MGWQVSGQVHLGQGVSSAGRRRSGNGSSSRSRIGGSRKEAVEGLVRAGVVAEVGAYRRPLLYQDAGRQYLPAWRQESKGAGHRYTHPTCSRGQEQDKEQGQVQDQEVTCVLGKHQQEQAAPPDSTQGSHHRRQGSQSCTAAVREGQRGAAPGGADGRDRQKHEAKHHLRSRRSLWWLERRVVRLRPVQLWDVEAPGTLPGPGGAGGSKYLTT